jgi:hypothetical protein
MLRLITLALLLAVPTAAQAQSAPCGYVDAIDYPIDITDTLTERFDDFGRFRSRFNGNHTGFDMGFRRAGETVRASMRGLVTYSDIAGWDTEKGVVVVEHTLLDNQIVYSLYGHMEEAPGILFPPVGACVERGQSIGVIGVPTLSLPHLHYEIRNFLPNDGGPGYVDRNPALDGWIHPLNFTSLLRLRLSSADLGSVTFLEAPDLPPITLDSGAVVKATGDTLEASMPPDTQLWRISADGDIAGLVALPGDRVHAYTSRGQAFTLQGGRYAGLWELSSTPASVLALGDTLVYLSEDGSATAYDPVGAPLWTLPAGDPSSVFLEAIPRGDLFALVARTPSGAVVRLIDVSGEIVNERPFSRRPMLASVPTGWLVLDGATLFRLAPDGTPQVEFTIGQTAGLAPRLAADLVGNVYIYTSGASPNLLAFAYDGSPRWRVEYPVESRTSPLLTVGAGCQLYTLDDDGTLNTFRAEDGSLIGQVYLYPGGERTHRPLARLLTANADDQLWVSAGFLSMLKLNGRALGGEAGRCVLG